jgi:ABC-type nitrate/sulfonate/bicarbonate transport system substrate-binding protein
VIRRLIAATVLCALTALPAQAAAKLNFMYTAVTQFVGLYVAKDQGMLAKHGLDIDMTLTTNGSLSSGAGLARARPDQGQSRSEELDLPVALTSRV